VCFWQRTLPCTFSPAWRGKHLIDAAGYGFDEPATSQRAGTRRFTPPGSPALFGGLRAQPVSRARLRAPAPAPGTPPVPAPPPPEATAHTLPRPRPRR
jgi:hypothetical protein